ncbi:MAG: biliverdin-producing heme oxygenase [Planctomycetes bacterium]|nr:biliverdin-producing heme oxygenase [Planctomycetota bacterium]
MQQSRIVEDAIMLELKNATQSLHDDTEAGHFNKELVMGRIPLEGYIESLAQLFLIHRALETHLARIRTDNPAIRAVVQDYQLQEPYLRADLDFFGRNPEAAIPTASVAEFLAHINRLAVDCPISLLGMHYVFEGSNNGSKYISNALRRAYSLEGNNGLNYFDPYGDKQREYWQAFKSDMALQTFNPNERKAMVDAARATFAAVKRLHEELFERFGTPISQAAVI